MTKRKAIERALMALPLSNHRFYRDVLENLWIEARIGGLRARRDRIARTRQRAGEESEGQVSIWSEYSGSPEGREEYRKWEEYQKRMRFDNMTPQEAAGKIIAEHLGNVNLTNEDLHNRIAEACQHFYDKGH